jgi:DNA-binding response OmpR family regulator
MMALSPEVLSPVVLVVDDEASVRDALSYTLRKEGYRVEVAETGPEAIQAARRYRPDAVVLDVMLPGMDGFQVCRTIRPESTVPILLLSARGEAIDRVVGLEIGADDYLTKPFAMRELLARVRAMLRRVEMMRPVATTTTTVPMAPAVHSAADEPEAPEEVVEAPVVLGDLVVDRARRAATVGGKPLTLRPREFDLLYFLARHPGVVHSRDTLLRRVWGYDYSFGTRTVDVHMRWLRQKIERDPANPSRLETVRGFGYRLVPHDPNEG